MTTESILPPPIYSQEDPDEAGLSLAEPSPSATTDSEPQMLIIPTADAINFQKGYLGAEGERAAIEGELQIKGTEPGHWVKVTMSLRTTETAYQREIELGSSEIVLFSHSARTALPSSFPFAIPLMPDTPQSIQTPLSSLSHTLTATLHPSDRLLPSLSKTLTVHTRRYTSHSHSLAISPETHSLDDPTRVEVELPRTTFKAGEAIPIYVIVPPPRRELVLDQGLRLRNVRAELVRVVKVKREDGEDEISDSEADLLFDHEGNFEEHVAVGDGPSTAAALTAVDQPFQPSSSKAPVSPLFLGSSFRAVIARSGASCRFHSSRPVQLRFVLHQPSPSGSPSDFQVNLPTGDHGHLDSDAECASITQMTLLHSVTFRINIHVSFVDMTSRTERISTLSIPVTILAPPAPLPEVEQSVDAAYQKKHDRPPVRTVRLDDADYAVPRYSDGEAGPSVLPSGAPPPFEERDAPPPFFSSAAEASTSSRLPTFLESETEIIVPHNDEETMTQLAHPAPAIVGEGFQFGFTASQQFDGHSEDMQRSSTPPPTLEMATRDTDLTQLADIREPERAIEALGLALDQHEETARGGELPPPPPPAMDDPSDPPPSIDSDFRSPDLPRQTSSPRPPPPPPHTAYNPSETPRLHSPSPAPPSGQAQPSHGHAPPPYLGPENHREHVTRPPPYVD